MKDSIENSGEKQCDGNPVDLILSHPELGEGARILLYWLWRLCGGRPNRILTNKHHLASLTRRDLRTIEGNLKRLKGAGRIDFDWDKARGIIGVYVFHPASSKPEPRPDPQKLIDFSPPGQAVFGPLESSELQEERSASCVQNAQSLRRPCARHSKSKAASRCSARESGLQPGMFCAKHSSASMYQGDR